MNESPFVLTVRGRTALKFLSDSLLPPRLPAEPAQFFGFRLRLLKLFVKESGLLNSFPRTSTDTVAQPMNLAATFEKLRRVLRHGILGQEKEKELRSCEVNSESLSCSSGD